MNDKEYKVSFTIPCVINTTIKAPTKNKALAEVINQGDEIAEEIIQQLKIKEYDFDANDIDCDLGFIVEKESK